MTKPELAPELIERCCKALIDADPTMVGYHETHIAAKKDETLAVLRASGYAELVEALVEARDDLKRHVGATHWRTDPRLFVRIDAALKAAGRSDDPPAEDRPKTVPLAAFRTDQRGEICECPTCGRSHWKMPFTKPLAPDPRDAEVARLNEQLEDALAALDTAKHHAAVAEWNEKAAHEAVNGGDAAVEWATLLRVLIIIDQAILDCDQASEPFASNVLAFAADVLASVRKKIEAIGPTAALVNAIAAPPPDPRDAEIARLTEVAKMVDAWGHGIRHSTAHESKMVKAARAALGDGAK